MVYNVGDKKKKKDNLIDISEIQIRSLFEVY